ncbi:hypothetical protein ACP3TJ_00015 [Desulforudis sp. 1088]|uniref:hypothetical protein n=1 Tax=unclassified Candidatus Desulforudis TaxID=2635950 RepID=UPI003CE5A4D2
MSVRDEQVEAAAELVKACIERLSLNQLSADYDPLEMAATVGEMYKIIYRAVVEADDELEYLEYEEDELDDEDEEEEEEEEEEYEDESAEIDYDEEDEEEEGNDKK